MDFPVYQFWDMTEEELTAGSADRLREWCEKTGATVEVGIDSPVTVYFKTKEHKMLFFLTFSKSMFLCDGT